jgi:hypothetical protein
LSASDFHTHGWLLHRPTMATATFRNTGNVLAVPRASVQILGHRGTLLATGIINQRSLLLLPGKQITTSGALTPLASSWLPARLTVRMTYRIDGTNQTHSLTHTALYVPPWYLLILLAPLGWVRYRHRRTRRQSPSAPQGNGPAPVAAARVPILHLSRFGRSERSKIRVTTPDDPD